MADVSQLPMPCLAIGGDERGACQRDSPLPNPPRPTLPPPRNAPLPGNPILKGVAGLNTPLSAREGSSRTRSLWSKGRLVLMPAEGPEELAGCGPEVLADAAGPLFCGEPVNQR